MTTHAAFIRGRPAAAPKPDAKADSVTPVSIRRASVRDLDTVVRLRIALLREYPRHPVYGRLRDDAEVRARSLYEAQLRGTSEVIFLAERAGEAIGILRCVDAPASPLFELAGYGYVSSVYVLPQARRVGVLRALLHEAEAWCRERGLVELRLHNVPGGEAESAWSALGFSLVEQVRLKPL